MQTDCPGDGDRWILAIYSFSPTPLGTHWYTAVATTEGALDCSFLAFL